MLTSLIGSSHSPPSFALISGKANQGTRHWTSRRNERVCKGGCQTLPTGLKNTCLFRKEILTDLRYAERTTAGLKGAARLTGYRSRRLALSYQSWLLPEQLWRSRRSEQQTQSIGRPLLLAKLCSYSMARAQEETRPVHIPFSVYVIKCKD